MALTINTRTYSTDRVNPDAVVYTGIDNTFTRADKAELKRVAPKPGGGTLGVARPTFKLTKSCETNAVASTRQDAIVTLSGSLPVGMTGADIDILLADIASFAGSQAAKDLFKTLDINQ